MVVHLIVLVCLYSFSSQKSRVIETRDLLPGGSEVISFQYLYDSSETQYDGSEAQISAMVASLPAPVTERQIAASQGLPNSEHASKRSMHSKRRTRKQRHGRASKAQNAVSSQRIPISADVGRAKEIVPPTHVSQPRIVPATVLEARRIAGKKQIFPSAHTRHAMANHRQKELVAVVRMCLSSSGQVTQLQVIKSSGYEDYDQRLLAKMRLWRYSPHRINRRPVSVCTAVTFVYRQR